MMWEDKTTCPDAGFIEKVHIFAKRFLKSCIYLCEGEPSRETFTQRLYAEMVSSSKVLEDLLDFHGAKNNRRWYFFRELVASVRNLSEASYTQKHIAMRMSFYNLYDTERFELEGFATHKLLIRSLRTICQMSLSEAQRLCIERPDDRYVWDDFPGIRTTEQLDSDIDDENFKEERKNIVKITTEFLRVARDFETHGFYQRQEPKGIEAIVPERFNEEHARRYELVVHSLQSSFDTYVNRSGVRFRDEKLKTLRGSISVVLHLMELTRRLLHYYERHLHEMGYKESYKRVRDELSKAVSPDQILDRIVNYGLYYSCHFLVSGKALAQELLNDNTERGRIVVGVPQKMGFHSRPSLLVAKIVEYYGGQVELCVDHDRFDASSVLDLQWAGGKIQNEKVQQVAFEGDTRALRDIRILAGVNYGEDSMGKGIPLPRELSYLKP